MNIKNWIKLYLTTLLIGGIVTVITGFVVEWGMHQSLFANFDVLEILMNTLWFIGVGLIFATLSHMGYFAYLTVHRFGMALFKSMWSPVQMVLIMFVLFDLVYFRYQAFAQENDSLIPYILIPLFLLLFSLAVAYLKVQKSNKAAFIPAVFFMLVITVIEWIPVLRINEESWLHLMLYPLLICNAFQLIVLPKYINRSQNERAHKQIVTGA